MGVSAGGGLFSFCVRGPQKPRRLRWVPHLRAAVYSSDKTHFNVGGGDQEGGSGEWPPSEFKVLEYVDWDFSDRRPPKAKLSAVSAAGGKGKKKGKK